jgi:hypothetical protein
MEVNISPKKMGRPNKTGLERDEEYFNKYYHLKSMDVKCECGALVNKFCLSRHMKRKIHLRRMKIVE